MSCRGFPRLYAAASLKRIPARRVMHIRDRFPRLYAAASLKHERHDGGHSSEGCVFRGFMPRPH